jgi:hypothetical protein
MAATYKIEKNKAGCRFAIISKNGKFGVWRECANYSSHVRGGIALTWRYVQVGMDLESAEELFERKIKGKQKQ